MECLILAAGEGSRLAKSSASAKPLLHLLGVPLLERAIRAGMDAGVVGFVVVTGHRGAEVAAFAKSLGARLGVPVEPVDNAEWRRGNGMSLLAGRELLRSDRPFLVMMADHVVDPVLVRKVGKVPPHEGEILLGVDPNCDNPLVDLDDVTKVRTEGGTIIAIGKHLNTYDGFDTGVFHCTNGIFSALERVERDQESVGLTDGVQVLAAEGKAKAVNTEDAAWIDVDDSAALDRAGTVLIDQLKAKPNDGPVSRYINRPLSTRISRFLAPYPVTPNQITLVSFGLSVLAALLFVWPHYLGLILGGFLAQFASVIDGCDGEIARLKYLQSKYGGWLDAVLDRYADALLLFGLTLHISDGNGTTPLWIGFAAIIGSFMVSYTADKYDAVMARRIRPAKGFRLGRDVRVFLIFVGALANLPLIVLAVIAVLMNAETVRRLILCRSAEVS